MKNTIDQQSIIKQPMDLFIIFGIVVFLSFTTILLIHQCFEIYVFSFNPESFLPTYNSENLPPPYNEYLKEIKNESLKRNLPLDKLKEIRFKIGVVKQDGYFAIDGGCLKTKQDRTIILPFKQTTKSTFTHEVGHCLFDYAHFYSHKNENRVMYWTTKPKDKSDTIDWDEFFSSSTEEPSFISRLLMKLYLIQE